MKNLIITTIILIAILPLHADNYDRQLARDSLPGSIYFVGPDVSADSLNQTYLYYSPDTGQTLHIRRTYDGDYAMHNIEVAADLQSGTVYFTDSESWEMFISRNFGTTWTTGGREAVRVASGSFISELAITVRQWSTDFGETFVLGACSGWPGGSYYYSTANQPGMCWGLNADGNIYTTTDYGDTFDTLAPAPDYGPIRRGHEDNEAFIVGMDYIDYETIYYSFDACTTFEEGVSFELPGVSRTVDGMTAVDRGWQQQEILALHFDFYFSGYPPILSGGNIRIFISTTAGETWRLVAYHSSDEESIHENPSNDILSRNKIEITGSYISSNEEIYLFNIQGKLIKSGQRISRSVLENGLYIAKTKSDSKKIINIK
jgi:hypothetical protein